MTLLLAEGFEFFHETAGKLESPVGGGFGPKFTSWSGASTLGTWTGSWPLLSPGPQSSIDMSTQDVRRGEVNEYIDVGRKGGRSLSLESGSGGGTKHFPCVGLGFKVKKSRTLYVGFALRLDMPEDIYPHVMVTFGRSGQRRPFQDGDSPAGMKPLGGCIASERGGYSDITWNFADASQIYYSQLSHGQHPQGDGDWHYYEFGTTILGNDTELDRCTAWGEARLAGRRAINDNIRTANVGEESESFIDCVSIRVACQETGVTFRAVFDDIYICNEEGEVNNRFLGTVYVRPSRPMFTAMLDDAYPVGAVKRHTAVRPGPYYSTDGPTLVGDPDDLPDEPPPPEVDPWWEDWNSPEYSRLVLPRQGNQQNFRWDDVPFTGAEPKVFGVTMDVLADVPHLNNARPALTPIKTTEGKSHTYFPYSSDMLRHHTSIYHLVMENPTAHEPGHMQHDMWRPNMINRSDYGFRIDYIEDESPFNLHWNPSLLRWPRTHEHAIEEALDWEDKPMRFWEEETLDGFGVSDFTDRFWACPVADGFGISDTSERTRKTYKVALDVVYIRDQFWYIHRFVRELLGFEETTNVDTVFTVEDGFHVYDLSYHEIVEQLKVWLDPVDYSDVNWVHTLADGFMLEVTDIWDSHFEIDEKFRSEDYAETNQLLCREYFGFEDMTKAGWGHFAYDGFVLSENHHDGWWVWEADEDLGFQEEVLTRVFRFHFFLWICMTWWHVGPWEQPLKSWEKDPCEKKTSSYEEYFSKYEEVPTSVRTEKEIDLRSQWIELGGDPAAFDDRTDDEIDLGEFDSFVFNAQGEATDMVDKDGNSIFEDLNEVNPPEYEE